MALTPELKRIYSSSPNGVNFYESLYLTHPDWDTALAYITNSVEPLTFNRNGTPTLFNPGSFAIALPKRDDLGLVDLAITFPITSQTITLIDLAEPSGIPITAEVSVYLASSIDPQMDPIVLQLDNIQLGNETGTGIAQRIDLLNRAYPRKIVRPSTYPGLWR